MKRLFLISISFMLLFVLASCGQPERAVEVDYLHYDQGEELMVSEAINELEFSSLEDFLSSYIAVQEGNIADVEADWTATLSDEGLVEVIEHVNFMGLEKFYLPTNIPETYTLFNISMNENFVRLWYLPEEHLVSEDAILYAISQRRDFLFFFTRKDMDSPKQELLDDFGMIEEELIDGRYVFHRPNLFLWASERSILHMYTPIHLVTREGDALIEEITGLVVDGVAYSGEEMVQFCQVRVVNLLDTNEIIRLIEEESN